MSISHTTNMKTLLQKTELNLLNIKRYHYPIVWFGVAVYSLYTWFHIFIAGSDIIPEGIHHVSSHDKYRKTISQHESPTRFCLATTLNRWNPDWRRSNIVGYIQLRPTSVTRWQQFRGHTSTLESYAQKILSYWNP